LDLLSVKIDVKLSFMMSESNNQIYQTGNLTVEPQLGQISDKKESVRLGPVNMAVLVTLIEGRGEVISRADLFDRVWTNQVVSDDTLTRCISDLRTSLAKLSDLPVLIETLPKRGYRWVPKVATDVKQHPKSGFVAKSLFNWAASVAIVMVMSLLLFHWLANISSDPIYTRVALLPVDSSEPETEAMALKLEETLKSRLLQTENIRFLSTNAIASRPKNPFPYLFTEFGAQWIIEGTVRKQNQALRVTLNLVDAKTAIVVQSLARDIPAEATALAQISDDFLFSNREILNRDN